MGVLNSFKKGERNEVKKSIVISAGYIRIFNGLERSGSFWHHPDCLY